MIIKKVKCLNFFYFCLFPRYYIYYDYTPPRGDRTFGQWIGETRIWMVRIFEGTKSFSRLWSEDFSCSVSPTGETLNLWESGILYLKFVKSVTLVLFHFSKPVGNCIYIIWDCLTEFLPIITANRILRIRHKKGKVPTFTQERRLLILVDLPRRFCLNFFLNVLERLVGRRPLHERLVFGLINSPLNRLLKTLFYYNVLVCSKI